VIYGTGYTSSGSLAAPGSVDGNWKLNGGNAYVVSGGYWLFTNQANSQWISVDGAFADFVPFTYSTTFDLTNYDPSSASLSFTNVAGDDLISSVTINGVSVGFTCSVCFNNAHSFSITSGFVSGLNTIEIVVENQGGPTGLQLAVSGTANPNTPDYICQNANPADWTYGQGYYCLSSTQFVQCYGEFPNINAVSQTCAAGTSCQCTPGVECSDHGTLSPCR